MVGLPCMLDDQTLSQITDKVRTVQATKAAVGGTVTRVANIGFTFAEVQAGAAIAGFVNGRFQSAGKDHLSIAGVPADLAAGLLGAGAAVFGFFGPALDTHVAAVSAGLASSYTYRTALAYGAAARDKSRKEAELAEAEAAAKLAPPRVDVRKLAPSAPSNVIRLEPVASAQAAAAPAPTPEAPAQEASK